MSYSREAYVPQQYEMVPLQKRWGEAADVLVSHAKHLATPGREQGQGEDRRLRG